MTIVFFKDYQLDINFYGGNSMTLTTKKNTQCLPPATLGFAFFRGRSLLNADPLWRASIKLK